MYLTRVRLNPRREGAVTLLGNPHRMHAAVMIGFPETPPGRVLWRLDADSRLRPLLWVVSETRPDLKHLIEQVGWERAEIPGFESREYDPLLDRLAAGQRYAFRLTANPTHRLRPGKRNERGTLVPHVTVGHQTRWLTERAEQMGARILRAPTPQPGRPDEPALQLQIKNRDKVQFSRNGSAGRGPRRGDKDGNWVTLTRVTYDGALEVTDPMALRETLTQGVGRARAYGCGLLTLAPLGVAT